MNTTSAIAAIALSAPAALAAIPGGLYTVDSFPPVGTTLSDPLVRIDPTTGAAVQLASTDTGSLQGIEFNPVSRSFIGLDRVDFDEDNGLLGTVVEIDPLTGATAPLAGLPFDPQYIARDPLTGRYFVNEIFTGNLYALDPTTLAPTFIGDIGFEPFDITFGGDGTLFAANRNPGFAESQLVSIDTTNAAVTEISAQGSIDFSVRGLAYDHSSDIIYAIGTTITGGQLTLFTIDPDTGLGGSATAITNDLIDDLKIPSGLTFVVPAPSSAALLGITALAATRRRRA